MRAAGRSAIAASLLALVCAAPRARAQSRPGTPAVFGAGVDVVYVDAFVTNRGQPVPGLSASDFELKDEGRVQPVELIGLDTLPLTAVLAFDTSGSVAGEKLAGLRAAGEAFLDGLRPKDEVALLPFNEELGWVAGPTHDRATVRAALGRLGAHGATAVLDALFAALTLPPTPTRALVVLFTDGEDNLSWLDERQVRAAAERSNALVHVVTIQPPDANPTPNAFGASGGPGPAPEPDHIRTLRQIAELTGGRLWTAESPTRLKTAFAAIAEAMSQRYVLRFEPPPPRRPGWHRLELRLRGRGGSVQTRHGYWLRGR